MKQLGVMDTTFVNLENPTVPQHVGGLGIYDPSTAPGGFVRFKDVLANFEQRLYHLPIYRMRLVHVPFGLDRPYWVLDPNFDVEFHIRHIALPAPGDWRQLCIQIARLHSRPIDMSRPLWEAYIIEGLDNIPDLPPGCFAVYTKMHHSMVDGAGGQNHMEVIHDLEPVPSKKRSGKLPPSPIADLQPSDVRLFAMTLLKLFPHGIAALKSSVKTVAELVDTVRRVRRGDLPPLPLSRTKSRFESPAGHNRVFEACEFALDDIKAVKKASGVTFNDTAVAIVAGALRKYLQAHNELPDETLMALMPVNMRTRIGETGDNNQVGGISAALHTDIDDPIERLRAIQKSTDEAKAFIDTPLVSLVKLPGILPPLISRAITGTYVRNRLTRYLPLAQATVITNVPGPQHEMYCAGAKLVSYFPLGLINPGLGLFQALYTCAGKLSITVTADREQMPDPAFYRQCLEASWQELRNAVLGSVRTSRKAKPAVTATTRRTAGATRQGRKPAARRARRGARTRARAAG